MKIIITLLILSFSIPVMAGDVEISKLESIIKRCKKNGNAAKKLMTLRQSGLSFADAILKTNGDEYMLIMTRSVYSVSFQENAIDKLKAIDNAKLLHTNKCMDVMVEAATRSNK